LKFSVVTSSPCRQHSQIIPAPNTSRI
jgi:hypothetical protein